MRLRVGVVVALLSLTLSLAAQTSGSSSLASVSVPPVIQFSNLATNESGSPLSGNVSITFSLYNNSQGGSALWTETQNVSLDSSGHYSVYLGITEANGIPTSLFTNGQAHWLGAKIAGQAEQ
jgi:trimeric autotransporter adhesin